MGLSDTQEVQVGTVDDEDRFRAVKHDDIR
jgi:hypothetical protein